MESNFFIGFVIGVFSFVVGNLILIGIRGGSKKVDDDTFQACIDALNKRLDSIEKRIAKIEEILLRK